MTIRLRPPKLGTLSTTQQVEDSVNTVKSTIVGHFHYFALKEGVLLLRAAMEGHHVEYKVYPWRWVMLFIIFSLNFSNATLWVSFAPIAPYTIHYYGTFLSHDLSGF